MFAISFALRCLLCRVAFVALCLTPTTGVLVWAAWLHLPMHREACRRAIAEELRVTARLGSVEHPRPGVTILTDLQLDDPATGQVLVRAPSLEVGRNGSSLVLVAGQLDVSGDCFTRLADLLNEQWRCPERLIALACPRLRWQVGERAVVLEQFGAQLTSEDSSPRCEVQFHLGSRAGIEPVRLTIGQFQDAAGPVSGYRLHTGDEPIACWLAIPAVGGLDFLGPRATFSGEAAMFQSRQGWRGEIVGRFRELDLRRLVSTTLPHEIHGLAELRLEQARFERSRLTQARGRLTAGPGLIGHSLRVAAMRGLELQAAHAIVHQEGLLPFEELALGFQLSSAGLEVWGGSQTSAPEAVLADRGQPLLLEPLQQPQPLAGLIRTLSPGEGAVPASQGTGWLLDVLPVP